MVVRRNSDTSSKDLIRNGEENWERWVLRNHVIRDGIWAGTQSPAAAKDLSTKLWGKLTEMGVEKSCSQRWCSRSNSVISSKGSKKVYARKIHTSQNTKQNSQNTKTKTSHQTAERCLSLCLSLSSSCSSWRWWPSSYASVSTGCLGFVFDVISRSLWWVSSACVNDVLIPRIVSESSCTFVLGFGALLLLRLLLRFFLYWTRWRLPMWIFCWVCVFRSSTELSINQERLWSCCDDETESAFMIQKNLHLVYLHELGRRRQSSSRLKVWILGFLACLFACSSKGKCFVWSSGSRSLLLANANYSRETNSSEEEERRRSLSCHQHQHHLCHTFLASWVLLDSTLQDWKSSSSLLLPATIDRKGSQ